MRPLLTVGQTRRARALALAALVMFAAVQGLEAAHNHPAQDSPGHCLLCKNSNDLATALSNSEGAVERDVATPFTDNPRAALAAAQTCRFARGPPTVS